MSQSDYIEAMQAMDERIRNAPDETTRQEEDARLERYGRAHAAASSAVTQAVGGGEQNRSILDRIWSAVFGREYDK